MKGLISSGRITRLAAVILIIPMIALPMLLSCSIFLDNVENPEGETGEEKPESGDSMEEADGKSLPAEEEEAEIQQEEKAPPLKLWVEDIIPAELSEFISTYIECSEEIEMVDSRGEAQVLLEVGPVGMVSLDDYYRIELGMDWVIAPVTDFFQLADDIKWEDIKGYWMGEISALDGIKGSAPEPVELLVPEEVYGVLEKMLGPASNIDIHMIKKEEVSSYLENNLSGIAIVPFDEIDKRYKLLNLDGMSVFDRDLDLNNFPLAFSVFLAGPDRESVEKAGRFFGKAEFTNRDITKLTTVMMTGVTAMARFKNIGKKMDEIGILYPAEKIADVLCSADITHISNEIPFVEGCTPENRFPFMCSNPDYIELLRFVGTDVIELTGNHMNDYGSEWILYTLDMYEDEGWPYFGGGRDLEDCYSPAIMESNGHRFAFLGLNWWGPEYAWASEDKPGSSPGPGEQYFTRYEEIIRDLKNQGYIVIFTFQYLESEQYGPVAQQITDFRRMINAGADIVSGSQSHYPMGMEFYGGGFINYGLGNLFFNMRDIPGLKQGIIAEHVFYDGRHINTVLITTMLENLSQVRQTTPEERIQLLGSVFDNNFAQYGE